MVTPVTNWLSVSNRSRKAGDRESPDQWFDRVLDLDPGEERAFWVKPNEVLVQDAWGRISTKNLPAPRREVLLSEHQRRCGGLPPNDWQRDDGAIVILRNNSEFFMSYKDDLHPNEKCRGRLCFLGGAIEENEPPQVAIFRELYEEVRDPKTVDLIAFHMVHLGMLTLPSVQWEGTYRCHVFMSELDDVAARDWVHTRTLLEGLPIRITSEEMKKFMDREVLNSGECFVASHHKAAMLALELVTNTR